MYKHIVHNFFKLGAWRVDQWEKKKGPPHFKNLSTKPLHFEFKQKQRANLWKITNNKDLPHHILRKSEQDTLYSFHLAL